jgi:hypothetical protein
MSRAVSELLRSLSSGARVTRRSVVRKQRRAKQAAKLIKRSTIKAHHYPEQNLREIMNDKAEIFLGTSDLDDLVVGRIVLERLEAGKETLARETTVLASRQLWTAWMEQNFAGSLITQNSATGGFILNGDNFLTYHTNSNTTTVRAHGDREFVERTMEGVEASFEQVTCYIEWIYSADGNSVNVPLNRERMPVEEMYPFLNGESLASYYDRYMASSANILLLIGPPGTGKTTFIRGLLAHRNSSAIVTYDAGILEKDGFFARFIEDDAEVMVLEDSDAFLKSRSDGNTMMHRFLNVGDGLVTTKGKKLVFSTNLPSIRDIDSALVRPGRCFDIITFDQLTTEQADKLADRLDVNYTEKPEGKYSIAEIFNAPSRNVEKSAANRKVGFI